MKPITVKWVHNGQELQRSARVEEVFVEEQGLAKLTIKEFAPEEVVQEQPVLEQPTVEEPPKIAELKFRKPLQPALTPNEERVLE